MKGAAGCLLIIILAALALLAKESVYTVDEREQALVTRFGNIVGEPVTKAGINFKAPFVDQVKFMPKQVLEWDGDATEMPTKDKTYISVDSYARWRIADPKIYFEKFKNEGEAITQLNGILGSETRTVVAKNDLIELVRTNKSRTPMVDSDLAQSDATGTVGVLPPIRRGRSELEKEIFETSAPKLKAMGIELLDIRFKRINYNSAVVSRIYERMTSERQQIAERFRSEGAGEAAKIRGNMEKELAEITSSAYKRAEILKGEADAKASEIYAKAFGQSPEAADFYEFVRTMELYEKMLSGQSTVVMSTDSDIFKFLKRVDPQNNKPQEKQPASLFPPPPAPASAPRPSFPAPLPQTPTPPQ